MSRLLGTLLLGSVALPAIAQIFVDADAIGANDGTSWEDAFTNLSVALGVAQPGDEIWVAAGIYKPTTGSDRNVSFELKPGVSVYGGFAGVEASRDERDWQANPTVLSGDIGLPDNNTDNSYHVVKARLTAVAILDGLIIEDGNADGDGTRGYGGGIYDELGYYFGSIDLRNSVLRRNRAFQDGGAIYNLESRPTITNCRFEENSAQRGGAIFNDAPANVYSTIAGSVFSGNVATSGGAIYNDMLYNLTLSNCAFVNNSARDGGAVFSFGNASVIDSSSFDENSATNEGGAILFNSGGSNSQPTLRNSMLKDNTAGSGGAVYVTGNAGLKVSNCTFLANSANDGGALHYSAYVFNDVEGSTFQDNTAVWYGGAIKNGGLNVTRCRFVGNRAGVGGGGVHNDNDATQIANSLFVGNSAETGGAANLPDGISLSNCTLYRNSATLRGGAVASDPRPGRLGAQLTNCIVWDNGPDAISGERMTVRHSCVQGGFSGEQIISADPQFGDADGCDAVAGSGDDNLRLLIFSPCVDDAAALGADLDGEARVVGPKVDLGAYEYPHASVDPDDDGISLDCDNCPSESNRTQHDLDSDGEGDRCDLDDGVLFFTAIGDPGVAWQVDLNFYAYNLYRGSLKVLRAGGPYTQEPGSHPYAARFCGLATAELDDPLVPGVGEGFYWLVTGVSASGETGLGDGSGVERPNAYPCP